MNKNLLKQLFYIILISLLFLLCGLVLIIPSTFCLISTIPYNNSLNYADLTNIRCFTTNENNIYYSTDSNSYNIYNLKDKTNINYTVNYNINNLFSIKNKLLIKSGTTLHFLENNKEIDIKLNLPIINLMDVYYENNFWYIGILSDDATYIYKFDENLNNSNPLIFNNTGASKYINPKFFTLSSNTAYIVGGNDVSNINTTYVIKFDNNNGVLSQLSYKGLGTKKIKYLKFNNEDYLIILDKDLNISNLSIAVDKGEEGKIISTIKSIPISDKLSFINSEITTPNDILIINNCVYVSDLSNKSIQCIPIYFDTVDTVAKFDIKNTKVILASFGGDDCRFNGVNDIYSLDGKKIFVADTLNNRIQIINGDKFEKISKFYLPNEVENKYPKPKSIFIDDKQNIYITCDDNLKSSMWIFDSNLKFKKIIKTRDGTKEIGKISNAVITKDDTVFAIDYTNNKILKFNTSYFEEISVNLTFSKNTKIDTLLEEDKLVILNDDKLYILNKDGSIICNKEAPNIKDIACDYGKYIYTLNNNEIKCFNFSNNLLTNDKNYSDNSFSNILSFGFCIKTREFICYNNKLCNLNIVKIDELSKIGFVKETIVSNLLTNKKIECATVKDLSSIYDLPYKLGNYYSLHSTQTSVFIIDIFLNYSHILFYYNGQIYDGYTKSENLNKISLVEAKKNITTINKNTTVFSYPVLSKYNNEFLSNGVIQINTEIEVLAKLPIAIDNKYFYIFKNNNEQYGYIFESDVIENVNKPVESLLIHNANVNSISSKNIVKVYKSPDNLSEQLDTLSDNYKIFVENYDRNSKFTLIKYMDSQNVTHLGYIETKYVHSWNFSTPLIISTIVFVICLILLFVIIFIYKKLNKRKI